jgi:signal transduction histidine kinase
MQPSGSLRRFVFPSDADRRRLVALAVVVFAVTAAARLTIANPNAPISTFYFVPVVALALAYGFRGALLATVAAFVAQVVWLKYDFPTDLSTWEIISRATAMAIPWLIFGWVLDMLKDTLAERERSTDDLERMHADLEGRARELEQANARLERANVELARSNRDLEQFANVASHDLKEPLRVVTGFVDLLDRRASDRLEPSERRFLASMRDATERMSALIDDVLAWSRAGSAPLELADVDMSGLVRDTRDNLAAAVEETGATIEVGQLPRLRGDARQLRQLFQNLIGNALKFHGEAAPHITVGADSVPEGWRFRVSDNGIGVDPAEADRIFQMFQRLHERDAYPGTGVGLAICSTVVERHGGRIWVEPTPGGGTTFCFTIAAGGLAAEVPPLPEPATDGARTT